MYDVNEAIVCQLYDIDEDGNQSMTLENAVSRGVAGGCHVVNECKSSFGFNPLQKTNWDSHECTHSKVGDMKTATTIITYLFIIE